MYLTCAEINKLDFSSRQALADCGDMHRNIMKLFEWNEEVNVPSKEAILFRTMEEQNRTMLYIVSERKPDLRRAAWLYRGENARLRDLQPLLDSFAEGNVYGFDLLAYPCKKVRRSESLSARVFLKTEEERLDWLRRQGLKNGFQILQLREIGNMEMRGKRNTGVVRFTAVRFSGMLQVTDREAFLKGYREGIGAEKAYGAGMLLLTRGR